MTGKELKIKIILALLLLSFILLISFYISYTEEIDIGDKLVSVIIEPGDNLGDVCSRLVEGGVVKSKMMLKYPARLKGVDKKLIPGRYDFTGFNSCRSVLERLEKGDFLRIKVTIPEGSTIWETASRLASLLELDSAKIHNLNTDTAFLEQLNLPGIEGYLFPETYYFPWGKDENFIVAKMVEMYKKQTDSIWPDEIEGDYTRNEIIILASIIEAETGKTDERGLVSSVYHNRLKRNMKLDADPTVIYGLGGLDRPLWRKDMKRDTPYNTYMYKDLPPTPINSPGLESIKAALEPEPSDYLFFVADETGKHVFSRTIGEHNRAVTRIRSNKN